MTKINLALSIGLVAIIPAAILFIAKPPQNWEALEQLQRLNDNLERLRGPTGLDMKFPPRDKQKFTA